MEVTCGKDKEGNVCWMNVLPVAIEMAWSCVQLRDSYFGQSGHSRLSHLWGVSSSWLSAMTQSGSLGYNEHKANFFPDLPPWSSSFHEASSCPCGSGKGGLGNGLLAWWPDQQSWRRSRQIGGAWAGNTRPKELSPHPSF